MPGIKKPKPAATPAKGSAPIRPPGGSTPKPKTAGSKSRPAPARPPTAPLSPLATQLAQRKLRAMQSRPLFAPPAQKRPPGNASMAPPPANQMQSMSKPGPVARPGSNPLFPGFDYNASVPQQASQYQPQGVPKASPNPVVDLGPAARELGGAIDYTVDKLQNRYNEAQTAINAPTYENVPPPTGAVSSLTSPSGSPAVAGTRLNDDGSEDWAIPGRNGQTEYFPKIRVNQPSFLQRASRAAQQTLGIGLEGVGLAAKGTERLIALANSAAGGATIMTPVILPDGSTYTPPESVTTGNGRFPAVNPNMRGALVGEGVPSVAHRLYGNTPEVDKALWEATRIGYSPGEEQLRAVARMVEFEQPPDQALYGDGGYVNDHLVALGYLDNPIAAIKADPLANYVYGTMRQQGMTDDEIVTVFNTQGLPGEQYLPNEIAGQVLLDPLNLVGGGTKAATEAERVARAKALFGTATTRTAEEIAAGLARGATKPYGDDLLGRAANFFMAKTPTAVKSQLVQIGGDAISLGLRAAQDGATPGAKGGVFNVLKAAADLAEAAPVRLPGQTDEAFNLATQAWRTSQQTANAILQKYPVMLSEAGKIGGALVRKLLVGQDGQLSTKLLTEIAESGKPPYEITQTLMGKLDNAAVDLLMPERAGARTVAEFVANTGKPAQEFPLFERMFAGASEAVQTEKSALAAGLDYKANPLAHALDGFSSVRNRVNSGLWKLFAQASPSYSARNALNNMFTALADGNLAFDNMGAIDDFLHVLGDPSAAAKGIGAGEVASKGKSALAGGFAGYMRSGDIPVIGKGLKRLGVDVPLGAQAVEEMFSKRIVYTAAKRYLDRMMVLGKAIPNLPPGLAASLGDDVVRQMVNHLAGTYGDVDGALRLMEKLRGGTAELWRVPRTEHLDALNEFGGTLRQDVQALMDSHKTPAELKAGFARLRRETAERLHVAEQSIPSLQAMTGDVAESYAEDVAKAAEAGIDPQRVTGASPEDFESRLAADQNRVATAQGTAFEALKRQPDASGFEAFAQTQERVTEGGRLTAERVKTLRTAAWDQTVAIRSMKLPPAARGNMIADVWRDYFAKRDQLWTSYRTRAVELWDGISAAAGVEMAPLSGVDDAAGMADYYRTAERDVRREMLASQGAGNFEQVRTMQPNGSLLSENDIVGFDWQDPRWGMDGKNKNRWNIDVSTGTVEPPKIWVNETGHYQWARPSGRPSQGGPRTVVPSIATRIEAKNGEVWKLLPANEVDTWVERFAESAGYDIGSPDFNWQLVEHDMVDYLRNKAGLAPVTRPPVVPTQAYQPVNEFAAQATTMPRDAWINSLEALGREVGAKPPGNFGLGRLTANGPAAEFWDKVTDVGKLGGEPGNQSILDQLKAAHRAIVEQAIQRGENVPAEVLADYPELVQGVFSATRPTRPGGTAAARVGSPAWETFMQTDDPEAWQVWRSLIDPQGAGGGAANITPEARQAALQRLNSMYAAEGNAVPDAIRQALTPQAAAEPLQLAMQQAPAPRPTQIPNKWTPADPRSVLSTLNSLEREALTNFGSTRPVNLSDEQWQLLQDWFSAVRGQTQEAKAIAGQVGSEARNFALLNYADKRNFDVALGVTHPYHYWYGRTYANWMKRAVQNPAMMANYGRYRGALETMHAALPEYWRQQLSTDDLGLDMETPLMFNLEQTMSPLYGLLGSDFTDPTRRRAQLLGMQGFGGVVEDAGALGPTPWAPLAWATALSSYMGGDREAGNAWLNNYLGTLPRAMRALTAQAGIGPAGGVNLDPQMLINNVINGKGLALNSMTQWERGRVATTLAGYFDDVPAGVDPEDWKAQVEEASYTQSGPLWDKAMQQMFTDTAPAVMTSYFAGLGFKGRSETETEVGRVYAEVASLRANYANMSKEEIAQAYLDLQRRNPIYELLMLSRANGPERDDAWIWEAMGRVGLGDREAWEAAGVSETALDAFFATKTTEGMDPALLDELINGANTINARNRPVSLEEQQRQLDAHNAYNDIQERLHTTFDDTGAYELQDDFFRIRDEQGSEAASAWMDALEPARQGLLRGLLDARTDAMMAAGAGVQRYFLDPERYEANLVGQYYDDAEAARPGIRDLSDQYWALRDARDFGPADLMLEEHPELKEFWEETRTFKAGVHAQVMAWLDSIHQQVPTTQGAERADFDPQGLAQDNLDTHYKGLADAQMGIYDSPYSQDAQQGGGGAPAAPGTTSLADQYRARYDEAQVAKLAETEGRQTYLTPKTKLAYGDADIQPLLDQWGPEQTAAYFDQPIAQQWPVATLGVQGLLNMLGEAESVREGLLAFATKTKSADWSYYVGLLRNMSDEDLDAVARRYPQLADARTVAEQARDYEQPSISALHDILGFTVSFTEAGNYSINAQGVKKDKKTGNYGPTTLGGGPGGSGGAGGGFSAGGMSRGTYARMGGRGGGGGGSSSRGGTTTADTGPDPEAEQLGSWITYATKLKADTPELLTLLMDFFDAPDQFARTAFMQRYPEIVKLLQSLGAEQVAALAEGYYSWRQDQVDADAAVQGRRTGSRSSTGGPKIIRYYSRRPSTTGLQ